MRYEVPHGGIPLSDCQYFVDQFIESFENTTRRRAQLHPDDPILASILGESAGIQLHSLDQHPKSVPPGPEAPPMESLVSDQPESADLEPETESGNGADQYAKIEIRFVGSSRNCRFTRSVDATSWGA